MDIRCVKLSENAVISESAYKDDAGIDLAVLQSATLFPQQTVVCGTGLAVEIPPGYVGIVASRSGQTKRGLVVANGIGVIDAGYRGELCVMLHNDSVHTVSVFEGEKVAQLLVVPAPPVRLVQVDELRPSERGVRGFGSSDM